MGPDAGFIRRHHKPKPAGNGTQVLPLQVDGVFLPFLCQTDIPFAVFYGGIRPVDHRSPVGVPPESAGEKLHPLPAVFSPGHKGQGIRSGQVQALPFHAPVVQLRNRLSLRQPAVQEHPSAPVVHADRLAAADACAAGGRVFLPVLVQILHQRLVHAPHLCLLGKVVLAVPEFPVDIHACALLVQRVFQRCQRPVRRRLIRAISRRPGRGRQRQQAQGSKYCQQFFHTDPSLIACNGRQVSLPCAGSSAFSASRACTAFSRYSRFSGSFSLSFSQISSALRMVSASRRNSAAW